MLQRRRILLETDFKVKRGSFHKFASSFANVSPDSIHTVSEKIAQGTSLKPSEADERAVSQLMKEINMITRTIPGSSASKTQNRNEMKSMMITHGLPSWFLTINPADIYNPII
ncbi:hypothetical protein BKA70DRAFT_1122222, partial [Coprinopsis sp. MPI-PUGE-AT-0042]